MDLLLAERLLLIALDPRSGKTSGRSSTSLAPALAGALVVDLLFHEAAVLKDGRLTAAHPPGDPLLEETLGRVAAKRRPRKLKYWVRALGDPRKKLLARLVERGVLAERSHRILWLFPTTRYELVEPALLEKIVAPLRACLMGHPSDLTQEESALVALVGVTGLVGWIVPEQFAREARRRAAAIAKGDVAGQAVSEVVRETQAAVLVVINAAAAGTVINR